MYLPVGSGGSCHGKLPVHRSRVSGMSLPKSNFSLPLIKAKSLLHTNDWKTEHEGHFYFVLFPLCGGWLQSKHPFNQEHKGSHLHWARGSQSHRTQRELFFFWILLQDISLGCHYGLLLDLPISAWMRKKIFFPNGQFRSPLNSTTWKNLKVKLYLVKLIWGGGWPRSSEIFHSYFSPLSSSDQMEPVALSEYLLPLNLYIILSNTVH